jgi:hypothetical protein
MQIESKHLSSWLILALWTCSAGAASAQFGISRFTVDGGGGGSTGGAFALGGTAGQPDAGQMSGGSFTLAGGFWAGSGGVPSGVESGQGADGIGPGALPVVFQLFPASPNPVTDSMVLAFDLPESRFVRVEIFDVGGRLVRVIANDLVAAGRNQRGWDRRDARGVQVPPGIYFIRFEAGTNRYQQKLVVVS